MKNFNDKINDKILAYYNKSNKSLLVFSDLHLNKNNYNNCIAVEKLLNNLVDYIKKNNIHLIIFLGDWFEKKDNAKIEELEITTNFLKELVILDCLMLFIYGNHDVYQKDKLLQQIKSFINTYSIIDNLIFIQDYFVFINKEDKFIFHFYPIFSDKLNQNGNLLNKKIYKETLLNNKQCIPNYTEYGHYIFGHFDLYNIKYLSRSNYIFNYNDTNLTKYTTDDFLIKNFDLSLLGHYHNIVYKKEDNKIKLLFVGSPYQIDFGDQNQIRGFWLLKNIFKDQFNIKFIENNVSPKFYIIKLSEYYDFANSKINVNELLKFKQSYIRIIIDLKLNDTDEQMFFNIKNQLINQNLYVDVIVKNDLNILDDKYNLFLENLNKLSNKEIEFNDILNLSLLNKEKILKILNEYVNLFYDEKQFKNLNIPKEDLINFIQELI